MKISTKFNIQYGNHEIHNKSGLDGGKNIIISSKGTNNGVYGFFDYDVIYKAPFITVPSTGSIGEAFVQTVDCAVDDNCLIMFPKEEMLISELYSVAAYIRTQKWRFVYGRQFTPKRLREMSMPKLIIKDQEFNKKLNDIIIVSNLFKNNLFKYKNELILLSTKKDLKLKRVDELFYVKNGKSDGIKNYDEGNIPYVSSGEQNNGIIGFVSTTRDEIFPENEITVSAFCKAHIQIFPFVARGNGGSSVKVLLPKVKLSLSELMWYQYEINRQNWRFSYGKMVSKSRIEDLLVRMYSL